MVGVLVYLIGRGDKMQIRRIEQAAAQEHATRQYIQSVSGGGHSVADELTKLGRLRDSGTITEAEHERQTAKLLA